MKSKHFAAIDLGTNSCRLLIADEKGRPVYKDTVATKLGEGMMANNCFTEEAINRGMECLFNFKQKMDKFNVGEYRAIATAACRTAKNGPEFIEMVLKDALIKFDVVDGEEEARLNLIGALDNVKNNPAKYVVVYDLGGGSTEVTLATNCKNPEVIHTVSIPWGARNSSEYFNLKDYNAENAEKLKNEIAQKMDAFIADSKLEDYRGNLCFVATSSTPLRFASMIEKFGKYDRELADGVVFSTADADKEIERILSMKHEELAQDKYIGEKRSCIFIPACIIFKAIYDKLGAEKITASLKSAKDGIIKEFIDNGKTNEISKRSIRETSCNRTC